MNDFDSLFQFESAVAEFWGAKYAVAVDCCTHALELSLKLHPWQIVHCPTNTYVSVPMMLEKINRHRQYIERKWTEYYHLTDTVIDAAAHWKQDGYVPNKLMCISFGHKKHINIGKGGMILLDDYDLYKRLQKMRYDGRSIHSGVMYVDDNIDELGYHYYMTPETAAVGLNIFNEKKDQPAKTVSQADYPDIRKFTYFENRVK